MTTQVRATILALLVCLAAAPAEAAPGSEVDPVGVWPLRPQPAVVHGFDPPALPYGPGHRGVDLLGRPGQPVHSALAGTVTYAGLLAGRGVVVVGHGTTRTTYEPVTASVTVGLPVAAGTVLGVLEVGGSHCFPRACLLCRLSTRACERTPATAESSKPASPRRALSLPALSPANMPNLTRAKLVRTWVAPGSRATAIRWAASISSPNSSISSLSRASAVIASMPTSAMTWMGSA